MKRTRQSAEDSVGESFFYIHNSFLLLFYKRLYSIRKPFNWKGLKYIYHYSDPLRKKIRISNFQSESTHLKSNIVVKIISKWWNVIIHHLKRKKIPEKKICWAEIAGLPRCKRMSRRRRCITDFFAHTFRRPSSGIIIHRQLCNHYKKKKRRCLSRLFSIYIS